MIRKVIQKEVYESIDGKTYEREDVAIQADKSFLYRKKINAIINSLPIDYDKDYYEKAGMAHAVMKLIEDRNRLDQMIRDIEYINKKYDR